MDKGRTRSQAEGDHIVVELSFSSVLPPETAPGPVRRDLEELATSVAHRFGAYCFADVELMTPDHPDHVIEQAHLDAELRVLHYDTVGVHPPRALAERERDRIRTFVEERKSPRLGPLDLALVRVAALELRHQWVQWGQDEELVRVGPPAVGGG
jgi:hypothetical protein